MDINTKLLSIIQRHMVLCVEINKSSKVYLYALYIYVKMKYSFWMEKDCVYKARFIHLLMSASLNL